MGQSTSAVKITPQDRSILDLKLQRDKLKKYQVRIQGVLDREQQIAKEALAAGNKAKALTALRQRKYQETLLSQTDGQLATLQQLVSSIEFSLVEKDVLFGLKQGNAVLKEIHKEMDLESVEKLMSDTAEGIAYQNEIDAILSNKMSAAEEEEVLEELAALQAEQVKASVEREKDARLEFLERKCYQLESELKRVGGPPSNYAPVNDATEALVASLRRENYELRQALKAEGEASEDNDASPTSDSASPVPSHGQTSPPLLPTHPLHRAPTSFSAATRQRIALAPQLLLRTPSSEEGDGEMDTGEQTQPYTFPGHAPPTPNSGGHLGGGTA
ncbi:hypothetical protein RQP46_003501 [Phenoliferia psychrophenolica]